MRIVKTHELTEHSLRTQTEQLHVYNGLDCCVTLEVFETIVNQLDNETRGTYEFSKALQGPILEMNMRGVLIDQVELQNSLASFEADIKQLTAQLKRIISEGIGIDISPTSPKQLDTLFYEVMKLPPVKKRKPDGTYGRTTDRGALEKLKAYFHAQPIINHILAIRDLGKKASFLRTDLDRDGRIRTSFNIAGTTTGRLASSMSDFGTGTNLQNIDRRLRRVFIPDPGMKFCNVDLEQADSRSLGAMEVELFDDARYLDACESGDLHTTVCRMAWTELEWTDDARRNRTVADGVAYRDMSYRDLAKRLGHGTNYEGQPPTMSKHTKVPTEAIALFQAKYFGAFPAHRLYHQWVRQQLLSTGSITALFGRKRHFFGRRDDATVIREAIAYTPQSMTADQIDYALLNIWRANLAQPLLQVHDSILLQYPERDEATVIPKILEAMRVPIRLKNGREFVVPAEAKIGWNWADVEYKKDGTVGNEYGLIKWKGVDARSRPRRTSASLLDRILY